MEVDTIILSDIENLIIKLKPTLIIFLIAIITIKVIDAYKNKSKLIKIDETVNLLFVIYLFFVFEIVTGQDMSYDAYNRFNIIPFNEILRYDISSDLFIKNIIGNVILFVPYGFFASHYIKANKMKYILLLAFLLSLSIEITQLSIGRVFDVDDIILNTLGGIIGYILYKPILFLRSRK